MYIKIIQQKYPNMINKPTCYFGIFNKYIPCFPTIFTCTSGIGAGMSAIPTIIIVQRHFTKRRAIAAALSSVGLSFWSLTASPLTRLLVELLGWRGALLMLGGFNIQMLVPAAMYRPIPTAHSPHKQVNEDESSVSFQNPNQTVCAKRIRGLLKYCFNKDLFTRTFVVYAINQCVRVLVVDTYYFRQAPLGLSIGLDPVTASFLPSILSVCMGCGRIVGGFLAKLLTPVGVYGLSKLISGTIVFILPFMPQVLLVYVILGAIFGLSMGK